MYGIIIIYNIILLFNSLSIIPNNLSSSEGGGILDILDNINKLTAEDIVPLKYDSYFSSNNKTKTKSESDELFEFNSKSEGLSYNIVKDKSNNI